jgi:hypothetical protein
VKANKKMLGMYNYHCHAHFCITSPHNLGEICHIRMLEIALTDFQCRVSSTNGSPPPKNLTTCLLKCYSFHRLRSNPSWSLCIPPNACQHFADSSLEVKRLQRGADHYRPSSTEVREFEPLIPSLTTPSQLIVLEKGMLYFISFLSNRNTKQCS